jgi:hypothetical protein
LRLRSFEPPADLPGNQGGRPLARLERQPASN